MLARHFTIICICAFAFAILLSGLVESAKQNRRGPMPISIQYTPQY